ncbi:hypothetical protein [Nocardia carnea]|uniref:hypothetical protein n=1 Tax=Nocardia carnea TaxID=37328 RepID=UPI00245437B5|nr:hypothetical protein [Nocardia carnea]
MRKALRRRMATVGAAALSFTVGMTVHGVDHAVRGFTGDDHHAAWPGSLQLVMAALTVVVSAVALVFAFRGGRSGALIVSVIGFGSAAIFLVIHLSPAWGINDSFVEADAGARVTAYSWVTATLGIAGALALGVAGACAVARSKDA